MLGGDRDRAGSGLHRAALGIAEPGPAFDDPHLGARAEAGDAARQPVDDAVLPGDGLRQIEQRRLVERDAERASADRAGHHGKPVGGVD